MRTNKIAAAHDIRQAGSATRATILYRALKEDIIRGVLRPRQWLRIDGAPQAL